MHFTVLLTTLLATLFATLTIGCGKINSTITYGDGLVKDHSVPLIYSGCHVIQGEPYYFRVYAGCYCNLYS